MSSTDWQPPIPLDAVEVPPFPVEALPPVLRDYAKDLAEVYQVPVDLAAVLMLSIIGFLLSQRVVIEAGPSWTEPTNLYVACALPPASRKSHIFRDVTAPLRSIERAEIKRFGAEVERLTQERRILETALAAAEKRAAKAPAEERDAAFQEAEELRQQLPSIPAPPRLLADDVTPEQLVTLLRQNQGRIALMSAEGGVFGMMGGRYNNGTPNLDVYLKAHSRDFIRVDRVNRTSDFVESPTLSMGLAVQPEVLRGLADNPSFRGRGLPARFLYSLPSSKIGLREINDVRLNPGIQIRYEGLINELYDFGRLPPDQAGAEPVRVILSPEASALFKAYRVDNEAALGPGGELYLISDWGGKLDGAVARITGILHAAKRGARLDEWEIEPETMRAAIEIGEYFKAHALAAFDMMGANPAVDDARYVLALIQRREWKSFSVRDVHQALRGRFKSPQDTHPALDILEEYGYVQGVDIPQREGRGRKPSPSYNVNPHCLSQNTQITQNVVTL